MNRSVLDRQMFRYGGSVPMQDGGIASLPQEMPMEAPMEPSPEMIEEMEMQQLQGAAMEQGVEPDVLEDTLAQHAESFARMDEAENYETVINEIRGDELPISARYEELAGMVGPEDAQATPESVLTLVQPVIQLASIDQGIGGLAAEEMMDVPVEGPMAEGIMSTIDMQGAEQEAVPPVNFNQGGAVPPVQYFNQGGVGAIPKIDLRTVPGMQNYSRAAAVSGSGAGQMGTYDFRNSPPASIHSKKETDQKSGLEFRKKVAAPRKLGTSDIPSQTTSAPSGNALEEPRTTDISPVSYEDLLDPEAEQAAMDRQKKLNKSQLLFAMSKGFGNIASGRGSLATRLSQGLDHVFGTMSSQAAGLKALKDSQAAARAQLKAAQTKRAAELQDAITLEKLKAGLNKKPIKEDLQNYVHKVTNAQKYIDQNDPIAVKEARKAGFVPSKTSNNNLRQRASAITNFASKFLNQYKKAKTEEDKNIIFQDNEDTIASLYYEHEGTQNQQGQSFLSLVLRGKSTPVKKMMEMYMKKLESGSTETTSPEQPEKDPTSPDQPKKVLTSPEPPEKVLTPTDQTKQDLNLGTGNLAEAISLVGGVISAGDVATRFVKNNLKVDIGLQNKTPSMVTTFLDSLENKFSRLAIQTQLGGVDFESKEAGKSLLAIQKAAFKAAEIPRTDPVAQYRKLTELKRQLDYYISTLGDFKEETKYLKSNSAGKAKYIKARSVLLGLKKDTDRYMSALADDYKKYVGEDISSEGKTPTGRESKEAIEKEAVENEIYENANSYGD